MNRTCLLLTLTLALVVAVGSRTEGASSLDANTMKAALRTAAPEEDGFIDKVVARVNKGTLPQDLVESTFLWARKKTRHKFQYFKRGLIVRAEQRGITL